MAVCAGIEPTPRPWKGPMLPLTPQPHDWWTRWDSNPHLPVCKTGVLPLILPAHWCSVMELNHICYLVRVTCYPSHSRSRWGKGELNRPILVLETKSLPLSLLPLGGDDRTRTYINLLRRQVRYPLHHVSKYTLIRYDSCTLPRYELERRPLDSNQYLPD